MLILPLKVYPVHCTWSLSFWTKMSPPSSLPRAFVTRLVNTWFAVQTELNGHYSAQRLLALHAYTQHYSLTHLLRMMMIMPLPCLFTIVALDIIPLDSPKLGTSKNLAFWGRSTIFSGILAGSCTIMFLRSIPMLRIPLKVAILSSTLVAIGSSLSGYALSLAIGFPLPFSLVLETPAWTILMAISLGMATSKQVKANPSAKALLTEWMDIAGLQNSTLFVYSLYNYAFVNLTSTFAQTALSVAMQLSKLVFKYAVNRRITQYPDIKAEAVIFNVEISHALFVTFSMQSATSILTLVVLVLLDFFHALATYYEVASAINHVQELEKELDKLQPVATAMRKEFARPRTVIDKATDILERRAASFQSVATEVVINAEPQKVVVVTKPTLFMKKHKTASKKPAAVRVVPKPKPTTTAVSAIPVASKPQHFRQDDQWRAVDRNLETFSQLMPASSRKINLSLVNLQDVYVERVLALLHMTEFAVLTEFVEFIVPMIYGESMPICFLVILGCPNLDCIAAMYVALAVFLPNNAYYPQLIPHATEAHVLANTTAIMPSAPPSGMPPALARTLTYSLVELISLFRLDWMLRRRLDFSPISQLAFRLESQWRSIHAGLILYVTYIIESTLEHHGANSVSLGCNDVDADTIAFCRH